MLIPSSGRVSNNFIIPTIVSGGSSIPFLFALLANLWSNLLKYLSVRRQNMYYFGTERHYKNCLTAPMLSSAVFGTIFAGIDAAQGARFTPGRAVTYAGGIYVYNALQCPMEALQQRQSLLHNVLAGGFIGYVGVSSHQLGIPFIDPMTMYRYPWLRPNIAAFVIYGGLAGTLAALGGKPL